MIGFVTEGGSDVSVVREICQKVGIKTQFRRMRGNNLGKGKRLAALLSAAGSKKIIILKDLHRSTPSEINTKFREAGLEGEAKLCIVVKAVESWLLADEKALSDYLGTKVKQVQNPEDISKPDELLDDIFEKEKGRAYLKGGNDPAEIAKRLRLRVVEKRCPSFKQFMSVLQN